MNLVGDGVLLLKQDLPVGSPVLMNEGPLLLPPVLPQGSDRSFRLPQFSVISPLMEFSVPPLSSIPSSKRSEVMLGGLDLVDVGSVELLVLDLVGWLDVGDGVGGVDDWLVVDVGGLMGLVVDVGHWVSHVGCVVDVAHCWGVVVVEGSCDSVMVEVHSWPSRMVDWSSVMSLVPSMKVSRSSSVFSMKVSGTSVEFSMASMEHSWSSWVMDWASVVSPMPSMKVFRSSMGPSSSMEIPGTWVPSGPSV